MPNKRSDDKVMFRAFLTKDERAELNRLVNESGAKNATDYIRRLLNAAIDASNKAKLIAAKKKNETNNTNNSKK